jgi:hypothetical protein
MRALFVTLALLVAGVLPAAESPSAFLGHWVLEKSQSHFAEGAPDSMQIDIEVTDQGVHYRSQATLGAKTSVCEYTTHLDGAPALVTGSMELLAPVIERRVDERTVEATYYRSLRPMAVSRRVINEDRSQMTITTTYRDHGRTVENIVVFHKTNSLNFI